MHLIVDGYNIIGAWPQFQRAGGDLSQARDQLIHILADYAGFTGCELHLVFDGYASTKKTTTIERQFGITVVYTRQHETADHYIERYVDTYLDGLPRYAHADIRVATNDALEQSVILARGAVRLSATELLGDVRAQKRLSQREHAQSKHIKPMTFEDRLTNAQKIKLERMRRGE